MPQPGDPSHPLAAGAHAPAIIGVDLYNQALTGEVGHTLSCEGVPHILPGVRRLTPVECERLQGFPDNWTALGSYGGTVKPLADGPRYKCLGNAVTVNVAEWIGRRLVKVAA